MKGRPAMTQSEYITRLKQVHGNRFTPLSEKQPYSDIKILCNWCGNTTWMKPFNLLNGQGCRYCSKSGLKSHEVYLSELNELGIIYRPIENYKQANMKIGHSCPKCHEEWQVTPSKILSGVGCPTCKHKGKVITLHGSNIQVRGYEPYALTYLTKKFPDALFITDKSKSMPTLRYKHLGKMTWTKPDIMMLGKNRYFEVKSPGTMGLHNPIVPGTGYKIFRKLVSRMEQISNYQILLFDNKGNRLILPRLWYEMSYSTLKLEMKNRYGIRF